MIPLLPFHDGAEKFEGRRELGKRVIGLDRRGCDGHVFAGAGHAVRE